jgi:mono/diheme cytochrome c family protein
MDRDPSGPIFDFVSSLPLRVGVESAQIRYDRHLQEEAMRTTFPALGLVLLASFALFSMQPGIAKQQQPDASEPKMTPEDAAKKNPISPTSEGLAEARKLYGYHCAMCHGKEGDGKGDLAGDMKLELLDWRDPASIEKISDGELFWVISNGRGKMLGGEGDRTPEKVRWNLVNIVRAFGKKGPGEKNKTAAP